MTDAERRIAELQAQLREAQEAHRIIAKRLAEYERSRSARMIRAVWSAERRLRDQAIKWRLRYRSLKRRLRWSSGAGAPGAAASRADADDPEPVHLTPVDEPVVSIIVPVHGQLAATAACLRSLRDRVCEVAFEVIIVDDASPDATPEWLAACSGLRVVTIADNVGFLLATNRGAAEACGRYLCLLNNDTEVHDGWLDALVATIERADDIGAVGAKLMYAGGEVQEGGAVIWSDGSGHNMGRGGATDDPAISFVREVDYCSAACLLVRAEVWRQLGGFDEQYVPAYYEDTDLAFRIRAGGRRVLYQPAAVVTHHEGVSHGTDTSAGGKAHQAINRERFATRWKHELANQPARGTDLVTASWRGTGLIIVVEHRLPSPDIESASVRIVAVLEELIARGKQVVLLPADNQRREPYATRLEQAGVRLAIDTHHQAAIIEGSSAAAELIVVSRPDVGAAYLDRFRTHAPGVPIAYDMVDSHALRAEREAATAGTSATTADSLVTAEKRMLAEADIVIAITEGEAELVRRRHPGAEVVVVPNSHRAPRSTAPFAERNGVLFVGSFLHAPNRDALLWLIDEIMPLVWAERPEITVHVVGSNLPDGFVNPKGRNIELHGWQPYLEPIFDRVRVSVAPLRYGAGLKGKVGDSLVRGVPVVATPIGAEGFGPVVEALAIGTNAAELAALIVEVHDDEGGWPDRSDRGRARVDHHLGPRAAATAVDAVLNCADRSTA